MTKRWNEDHPADRLAPFLADIPDDVSRAAHRGTSHVPERRGEQEREDYARTLAGDLERLSKLADTDTKRAALESEFSRYRAGYRERSIARLSAMSRCMSTMITGGSNFPIARNRKHSDRVDSKIVELIEYRERALKAITKTLCPELAPVMAGDADAVERLESKIADAERTHERMLAANKVIRAGGGVPELVAIGFSDTDAARVLAPDPMGRAGFPSYAISNSGTEIRRLRERLTKVREAKATPATEQAGALAGFEDSPADNRVRVRYPSKPDAKTIAKLKRSGFRWAPSVGCWQAYRNPRTIADARRFAGVTEATAPVAPTTEADPEIYACPDGAACTDPACLKINRIRVAARVGGAA